MTQYVSCGNANAQAYFNNDMRLSQDKLHAQDRGAVASAEDARAVAESNRQYFSESEYQTMVTQVNQELATIKSNEQEYNTKTAIATSELIKKQVETTREAQHRDRERQVNKLMGEAQQAYSEQQYQQAAEDLQGVFCPVIDSNNNAAKLFLEITSRPYQLPNQR